MATSVTAPMVGKILRIEANPGQAVEEDDVVIVMEAMKMEIPVVAPADGTVKTIHVEVGQSVEAGEDLAEIEEPRVRERHSRTRLTVGTWEFGLTVALVGSIGTLLVLWLLSLLILLIKKVFPS